jgi:putative ABC transport system permease protein
MEAVAGATAARKAGLAPGSTFASSHGLGATGSAHGEAPYRVVGVLAPTGTVIDRLLLTSLESVWEVHDDHTRARTSSDEARREITALLVKYRSPIAAATMPRQVNATTMMQAASPAFETARLMNLVGVGVEAIRLFAMVLMGSAALSIFVALNAALQERRYDLALLRMLGARPSALLALVAAEGMTLVVAGVILGFALGHAAIQLLGRWIAATQLWSLSGLAWEPAEAVVALAVVAAGLATCLIPALQAYRRDPAILLKR